MRIRCINERNILTRHQLQRHVNHSNKKAHLQSQCRVIARPLIVFRTIFNAHHDRQRQREAHRKHINKRGEVKCRLMRSNNLCAEFGNEKRHNAKDACFHKNSHTHRHTNAQIFCHQMLYWAHKAQHIILLERLQLRHHHREHHQKQPKGDARCYAGANAAQAR